MYSTSGSECEVLYEAEEQERKEFVATRPLVEYYGGDSPSGSFMSDDSSVNEACGTSNVEIPDRSISALGSFSFNNSFKNLSCVHV